MAIELDEQKLNYIINLRENGANWSEIERKTGIKRRTAKREFDKVKDYRLSEEFNDIRKQIAMQKMSQHISDILTVADALVQRIPREMFFDEYRCADDIIDNIWKEEFLKRDASIHSAQQNPLVSNQRIIRQNKLIFKCLREHTRTLRWQVLDEWKQVWEDSIRVLKDIEKEAEIIASQEVTNSDGDIRLKKTGNIKNIFRKTVKGTVEVICLSIRPLYSQSIDKLKPKITVSDPTKISCGNTIIETENPEQARLMVIIGERTVEKLSQSVSARKLGSLMERLRLKSNEIDEMLEPLRLPPLILRTRCELCPA